MTRRSLSATSVVWFRRDLRMHDHPALAAALARSERIVPLFVVDPGILNGRWRSANRTWFMLESLRLLAADLEARGARLVVAVGRPETVVPAVAGDVGAIAVHVSREYTPYGRRRDRAVADVLAADGIAFHEAPGLLVHEPEETLAASGRPYAVFRPFHRTWASRPIRDALPAPDAIPGPPASRGRRTRLPSLRELGFDSPTADERLLPVPGERAARARLERWTRGAGGADSAPVDGYAERRDRPAVEGTSRLGQDLRWGLLSPVEVAHRVGIGADGRQRFATELCWRDFYAHVLWHEPRAGRESFVARYDALAWRNDPLEIAAWVDGRTGYPIVDAAMRELRRTGWMHNRARMIVASFLTKDLLVDWRVGEAHFMEHLVDADPASNNGGWQWAASTGTDAQPYFRIFNPVAQGERHDPEGEYVRRWLPELVRVPARFIHRPWEMPLEVQEEAGCRIGSDYPSPIVDHRAARVRALEAFTAVRRGGPPRPDDSV